MIVQARRVCIGIDSEHCPDYWKCPAQLKRVQGHNPDIRVLPRDPCKPGIPSWAEYLPGVDDDHSAWKKTNRNCPSVNKIVSETITSVIGLAA